MPSNQVVSIPTKFFSQANWKDLIAISKWNLLKLVLFTTILGYVLESNPLDNLFVFTLLILGTVFTGASSQILNQWMEKEEDSKMERTQNRPLPTKRISMDSALLLGVFLSILGILILYAINPMTGVLAWLTWSSYLFIYTPLKKQSVLNTWFGALPGALPPLIGWSAAQGEHLEVAITLFLILYFWQIPHFLALAWKYKDEYKKAGFLMLPEKDTTGNKTSFQIIIHAILLFLVSLLPFFIGFSNWFYLIVAVGSGLFSLYPVLCFHQKRNQKNARSISMFSIIHLPLLLGGLLLSSIFSFL